MTCIAAVIDDGKVYLGGDSLVSNGYATIPGATKVHRIGDLLMGFSGDVRDMQILKHAFTPPKIATRDWKRPWRAKTTDIETYLAGPFANALKQALGKDPHSSAFVIGHKGRLFVSHIDYAFTEHAYGYVAIGTGGEIATGSLATSTGKPLDRLKLALEAAEKHAPGVRRPFTYLTERGRFTSYD